MQRATLAPVSLTFRLLGRSCHKLWWQFACASVVRDCIRRWLLANSCCVGTQTRPDSAPNGIQRQEDCFATCCVGSDVAHFLPVRPLVSQTLAAIRMCKCRERLDSPMVVRKRYIETQIRPDSAPNGIHPTPGRLFHNVLRWLRRCSFFASSAAHVTNSGGNSRVQVS